MTEMRDTMVAECAIETQARTEAECANDTQADTRLEMARSIAGKCQVSLEEAKAALEAGDWNMLTAAQWIESEKLRRMQELDAVAAHAADDAQPNAEAPSAAAGETAEGKASAGGAHINVNAKKLRRVLMDLIACGNRNRFVIRRKGEQLLELPVTAVVLLMVFAFWTCIPLLVVGLFLGCQYSFTGREFEKAVETVKRAVAEA